MWWIGRPLLGDDGYTRMEGVEVNKKERGSQGASIASTSETNENRVEHLYGVGKEKRRSPLPGWLGEMSPDEGSAVASTSP